MDDPFVAHAALQEMPAADIDLHLLASYLSCCNRCDEAIALLEEARALGHRTPETTKLLLDLFFRRGEVDAAIQLARADAALLSPNDSKALQSALCEQQVLVADHASH